jgi:hypothetical protein
MAVDEEVAGSSCGGDGSHGGGSRSGGAVPLRKRTRAVEDKDRKERRGLCAVGPTKATST